MLSIEIFLYSSMTEKDSWWFYFTRLNETVAACKEEGCTFTVDQGPSKGTNSLKHHLQKKHPALWKKKEEAVSKKAEKQQKMKLNQPKLDFKSRPSDSEEQPPPAKKKKSEESPTILESFSKFISEPVVSNARIFSSMEQRWSEDQRSRSKGNGDDMCGCSPSIHCFKTWFCATDKLPCAKVSNQVSLLRHFRHPFPMTSILGQDGFTLKRSSPKPLLSCLKGSRRTYQLFSSFHSLQILGVMRRMIFYL